MNKYLFLSTNKKKKSEIQGKTHKEAQFSFISTLKNIIGRVEGRCYFKALALFRAP